MILQLTEPIPTMASLDTPNFFSRKTQRSNPALDELLRKARASGNTGGRISGVPDTNLTREYTSGDAGFEDPTAAMNAGASVTPWANSSGTMGGGYGFGRRGGGLGGFSRPHEPTKRPSASTADEYYANRDLAQGNPIENLKMHGPNRNAYMDAIRAEAGGGDFSKPVQGVDAYFAGKGLGPDGQTQPASVPQPLSDNNGFDGFGAKTVGNATAIQGDGTEELYGPTGKIGSSTFAKPIQPERAPLEFDQHPLPLTGPSPTTYTGNTFTRTSPNTVFGPPVPKNSPPPTPAALDYGAIKDIPTTEATAPNNGFDPLSAFGVKGGLKDAWKIFKMMGRDFSANAPKFAPTSAFGR